MDLDRPTVLLPLAVFAISVVLFLPRLFPNESPKYDFLYAWREVGTSTLPVASGPNAMELSEISGGYIRSKAQNGVAVELSDPTIRVYLHHVEANTSVPISIEDIGSYHVVSGTVDPDGFAFVKIEPGFFKGGREDGYALTKGINNLSLSLNIPKGGTAEVLFLGWVK